VHFIVSNVLDLWGSLLAPDCCAACDEEVPRLTAFCRPCALTLVRAPPGEPDLYAPYLYGGALALAIVRLKYERRPDLARPLGAVAVRGVASLDERPDLVVPVPLHPARLVQRGYNQAALLARPVARALGARFEPRALARLRDTAQQANLDRAARSENVARAFAVPTPARVRGRRVLLVDDVSTTGATLRACASALEEAGAGEVVAAVVARTEKA